jgi:hypothetical protein
LVNVFSTRRSGLCLLLVLLSIILMVPAGSAFLLKVNVGVSPSHVNLGQPVTISVHVYALDYPGVMMANVPVKVRVTRPSLDSEFLTGTTNATGWAQMTYTPPELGDYGMTGYATVDTDTIPGLPPAGVQTYPTGIPIAVVRNDLNVTAAPLLIPRIPTQVIIPLVIATTTQPVVPTTTTQQTPVVPPATIPVPAGTGSPATITPAAPSPSLAVTGSPADTTPPVTTLTLAGTEDGNGGYTSAVICTLAAGDNDGGSGVRETEYSFDGAAWYEYTQPVSVTRNGMTALYYRSADRAGNREVAKVRAIIISGQDGNTTSGVPGPAPTRAGSSVPLWSVTLIVSGVVTAAGGVRYLRCRLGERG